MKKLLEIKNLTASIEGKKILSKLNLTINAGEFHVIMGPNGSGKSTTSYAILGHPKYKVTATTLKFDGKDIKRMSTDKRARLGLFLGFQNPLAITGVSLSNILPEAMKLKSKKGPQRTYGMLADAMAAEQREQQELLKEKITTLMTDLQLRDDALYRSLNDGFSGGEKKRAEILQMMILRPKLAILDEPDSGLDIDGVKLVAQAIKKAHGDGMAIMLITHYQRILKYLKPDKVHILTHGKIMKTGNSQLAREIELKGYKKITA